MFLYSQEVPWLMPTVLLAYGVMKGDRVHFHQPHLQECLPKRWSWPCTFTCSLCMFLLPSALHQPHHAGNIISPGVKEIPCLPSRSLPWECTGPLHGAYLGCSPKFMINALFTTISHDGSLVSVAWYGILVGHIWKEVMKLCHNCCWV